MNEIELSRYSDAVNELLARYGVKFGIYKNNQFKEQLFPFDAIPRIISNSEFQYLEKGLKQRVMALNLFIKDIYSEKKIIRDHVVPEEFGKNLSTLPAAISPNAKASCRRKIFLPILQALIWFRERIKNGTS